MSDNWDMYWGYMDDNLFSILLDMDVWKEVNKEQYDHSFVLKVFVKEPNEDGFPVDLEADTLHDLEDTLSSEVSGIYINVGRITTNGTREIIFYSDKNDNKELVEAANKFFKVNGYDFNSFKINEEETWDFYHNFLYPNIFQQHHMSNRPVVDALRESGDKLEIPRKVEHCLYFNTKEMLGQFKKITKEEGFVVEDESDEKNEDGRYLISISRTDAVDFHSINHVTDLLVEIAEQHEGEYEGWETFVVKD